MHEYFYITYLTAVSRVVTGDRASCFSLQLPTVHIYTTPISPTQSQPKNVEIYHHVCNYTGLNSINMTHYNIS